MLIPLETYRIFDFSAKGGGGGGLDPSVRSVPHSGSALVYYRAITTLVTVGQALSFTTNHLLF